LWVVQYLQYPFPAGLTINRYDQYLRARYNAIPAAPPRHVRGADKITLLEDKDGDGTFESHKDVITGLNITTSVLTGRGGIWVMNPPYLLFYRDRTADGVPDGDPEVRLSGFGLEDTHSLANSLTWGPDGWLYGVHGSTSTSRVRDISFLGQAVWRYHPETDAFELFAQGGGNPWTLSFDSRGRAFSGDNGGNSRGFHWVPGGRYEKNWPKHGPFTRPFSFGKDYAQHPRVLMPGGKGDYTDWQTNYTAPKSDRNLTRAARLLEMAPVNLRDRLVADVEAALDQAAPPERIPDRLATILGPGLGTRSRAAAAVTGERGREAFLTYCGPCHQTDGSGMEHLAPPLRQSTWVLGSEDPLIRIALHGLRGQLVMPAMGTLDDQQLSGILTYVRRAWGHSAGPVAAETVARVRAASEGRRTPWTREELAR
jgi:mono/diheme cytochrome c family protein